MPVYRNDTDPEKTFTLTDINGKTVYVKPGAKITTYEILDISGFTLLDAAPRWNPVVASESVTETGTSVNVDADTSQIVIINDSSVNVDMSWGDTGNTPATPIPASSRWEFPNIKGVVSDLIFTFSGTIEAGELRVVQMRG